PPALDIIKSSIGFETEGYLHQLYYYYPLRGGYQAISNAWAKKVPVRYNFTVKKVEKTRQGKFIVSDGRERLMFDRIISTIPIHELVKLINIPIPGRVKRAIKRLIVNPTYGVCLGIKGVDKNKFTAVYFPEASFLVNRINFPKTFSPFNAPKGYYSLQAEIVCRKNAKIWREKDDVIINHVIDGLIERRIIENRKDIVYKKVLRSEYAYVVYDTEYEKNTDIIRNWFPKQGIHLVGRFSYFEYVNVDMVIARSLEIASLLNKSEKISILSPAHQNEGNIRQFAEAVFKDVVKPLQKQGIKTEVIIAEDGSTDKTGEILQSLQKKYPLKLLLAKERLGPVQAIKNLFAEASGDLIFFLDSDGEISPRYFWNLYEVFKKENLDVAVAYKMKRKPWYRFLISRVNNFWLQLLFNTGIRDSNSGFRLYKAEIGKWLVQESGFLKYNFNSEQIILAVKRGFKVGETGTPHHARESMVFRPQKLLHILFFAFLELFKFRIYLFERNIFTTFALLIGRYSRRVLPLRFAQSKRLVGQMGLP
ncbi:glycosyltransferase, partial [Candidatus Gottesmanbacteria bacterium]|nr:glycosyltransferase [Candidatus Gottesmanbacteria bacterium]